MWIGCLNNKKFCFNFPFAIWDVIPCADIDFFVLQRILNKDQKTPGRDVSKINGQSKIKVIHFEIFYSDYAIYSVTSFYSPTE